MCYLCPRAVFVSGSVLVVCCRVEVWHILFMLNSLYSVFNILAFIQHTINVVLLLLCTHIVGRFFARE